MNACEAQRVPLTALTACAFLPHRDALKRGLRDQAQGNDAFVFPVMMCCNQSTTQVRSLLCR